MISFANRFNMRRGVGVSAIKKKKDDAIKFQAVG